MQQHFCSQCKSPPQKMSRLLQTSRSSEPYSRTSGDWGEREIESLHHFTVVYSVAWPLNGRMAASSKAAGELVLIKTSMLLLWKSSCSNGNWIAFKWEKPRGLYHGSPTASIAFTGPITKHTTVKWLFLDSKSHGKTRNVKLTEGNKKWVLGPLAPWNDKRRLSPTLEHVFERLLWSPWNILQPKTRRDKGKATLFMHSCV